ncbi:MAG TPA: cupredoxin domain-containing protein [Gaiella sp.]|nr:cupredoxin domain-containing protein [Gaiella sp.]
MSRRAFAVVAVVAGLALAAPLASLAADTGTTARKATTVTVTAGKPTEFHFTLSKASVPKGSVTFKIVNKGKLAHDFKIAGKKSKMVQPGKSTTLKVTLKSGKQKYQCTVPGHAAAGMKGTLKVK